VPGEQASVPVLYVSKICGEKVRKSA